MYHTKEENPGLFDILEEVKKIIGDRQKDYREFSETMQQTAILMHKTTGHQMTGEDVAMVFVLNKLIRCRGQVKRDNIVDAIAYLCVYDQLMRK